MKNLILGILIAVLILSVNFNSFTTPIYKEKVVSCKETCTEQDVKNIRLLAEVIYFEARSEPTAGQAAVAWVVMNRTASKEFPKSIEKVVKQGTNKSCQFSYRCDNIKDVVVETASWKKAVVVATLVYNSKIPDPTYGAEYYLNPDKTKIRPNKAKSKTKIGNHLFYNL